MQEARLALGGTQPGQGVPLQPLVTGVHDSNAEVALWSLVAIAGLGTEAALAVPDVISQGCQHPRVANRQAGALALSRIAPSDRRAVDALLRLLDDEHVFVRREALQALGNMRNLCETDIARVAALKGDQDPNVARWAGIALRSIGSAVSSLERTRER